MTTDAADPVEAVGVAPAADAGFLQRYGATIEYILIPGRGAGRRARGVRDIRGAVRQESPRSLFLHVPGRVRDLVLLAKYADARRASDPDGAVHRAACTARHGHYRWRRRAADRRARRHQRGPGDAMGTAADGAARDGLRRHDRRRPLDHAGGRLATIPRGQ